MTKIERYDYRPNAIEPCRIAGVLQQIDAFLRTRKVKDALETPGYRASELLSLFHKPLSTMLMCSVTGCRKALGRSGKSALKLISGLTLLLLQVPWMEVGPSLRITKRRSLKIRVNKIWMVGQGGLEPPTAGL